RDLPGVAGEQVPAHGLDTLAAQGLEAPVDRLAAIQHAAVLAASEVAAPLQVRQVRAREEPPPPAPAHPLGASGVDRGRRQRGAEQDEGEDRAAHQAWQRGPTGKAEDGHGGSIGERDGALSGKRLHSGAVYQVSVTRGGTIWSK